MASNNSFRLQAFILMSLSSIVVDVSCVGLASYAATPYAVAAASTGAPGAMNPNMAARAAAYATGPYANVPCSAAAYATAPYLPAPYPTAPCATPIAPMTTPFAPTIPARACSCPTPALAASSGGGFTITSLSPVAPNGVSILSENSINGGVAIAGEVPFLSVVTLDGTLPTAGAGRVSYTCGNGEIGMVAEDYRCGCNGRGMGYDGYAMGCGYDRFAPGCGYNMGYRTMY